MYNCCKLSLMAKYKGYNITRSQRKGKKYKATKPGKPPIHFGAEGYRIKPGTDAADNYCARSAGISSGEYSPNAFARALWSCQGKKSTSKKPFFGKIKIP